MTKQRCTFTLDANLIAKARALVQDGVAPSLVGLVERGLRTMVRLIEARRGQRCRVRAVRLKAERKGHE